MANQIQLTGGFLHKEMVANAAISPGMLVEEMSTGKLRAHAAEGGYAERAVAIEDAYQGKTVDDAYAADDQVFFHLVEPGAEVQMLIQAGQDIAVGDKLISAGDGTLIENGQESSGVTVRQIIAVAIEDCDLTDSDAENALCAVRIL
jgi:hypothetical protein